MDFKIGEGFRMEADQASVDLAQQSNDVVKAAFEEAQRVGVERGLWVPAGAGSLAVATQAESPSARDKLLATAEEGGSLYNTVISGINEKRRKIYRIPVLKPGEYREQAEDWLTDELIAVSALLPETTDRPLLIIPSLSHPVSREETVEAISSASDRGLWPRSERMEFLSHFIADELSGFDPYYEGFQIVPTAYDASREGTVYEQNAGLAKLNREVINKIYVSPILMTAVIGYRYKGMYSDWRDTFTRAIDLEPTSVDRSDCVPQAYVDGEGHCNVYGSNVQVSDAARLLVKS